MTPNLDHLTTFFENLGADQKAAKVMAAQLLKRADQLAAERSVTPVEALEYLLKVALAGKEGRVYEGTLPANGATMRDEESGKD